MGLNKFSSLLDRDRESYLSFEYQKLAKNFSNPQKLTMNQNLSSEDKLKVSRLLSEGISLFFSMWGKDKKKMPIHITKDDYYEYTLDIYNPVIEYFDKVLELDKENTQALEYKAHSLFLNRYFEEAIEIYMYLVSNKENDSNSWNDLGVALMEYGLRLNRWYEGKLNYLGHDQLRESMKCFDSALRINHDNICSMFNLALLYRSMDNFFAASVYYNRALEIDEKNIYVLINAANNYLLMDLFSESKELYKKAIIIDPDFMKKFFDENSYLIPTDGHYDLMFLKMGVELYPNSPIIHSEFIEIALRRLLGAKNKDGVEINDILRSGRKLIELGEHDYVLLELAGRLIKHFPDECLEILEKINIEKAIENGWPSDLYHYGNILSNNGNEEEADRFYRRSLNAIDLVLKKVNEDKLFPTKYLVEDNKYDFIKYLFEDKIEILIAIGDYDNAEKCVKQLKEYGIDEPEHSYKMGLIYYKKAEKEEKKEQELKYYNKACVFFDEYLFSIPEDAYIQILRIDTLKNYAERGIVLDSIRTMINGQNLEAEYYDYLLNVAFSLEVECNSEEFELCGKIFDKATTVIQGGDIKKISLSYAKIQDYIHSKDKEEKEQLKEQIVKLKGSSDENIKSIQKTRDDEIIKELKEFREENKELHYKTHRGIEELKEIFYTYSSKLDEIKNSTDTIDKKVDKIHNQTSKTSKAIREKYPELFEEKKKEIRKKLGI